MPVQDIIESYPTPDDKPMSQLLPAPAVPNIRVRVHLSKQSDSTTALPDDVTIDLAKFSKDIEFNVRKFSDKGVAVSARDTKNNAVYEFIYDNAAGVKRIDLVQANTATHIFLNQAKIGAGPDGPITIYSPDKLPIEEVQKTFKKALEDSGFKFYQEDPAIDKKKGHELPNPRDITYSQPIPQQGEIRTRDLS